MDMVYIVTEHEGQFEDPITRPGTQTGIVAVSVESAIAALYREYSGVTVLRRSDLRSNQVKMLIEEKPLTKAYYKVITITAVPLHK